MTLKKLLEILETLKGAGHRLHGCAIYGSGTGELCLELNTQPEPAIDRYLRAKGFVLNDCTYVYRPR